jgi:hypothetical protein
MVEASGEDSVRMGINLGPVKLVKDINGHPNIIGDGINVAQRIMSFARPGQIVVSRSYYDVVSNLASEYAKLFTYEGSRTDKHVREHEIYVVGHNEGALQKAKDGIRDRATSTTPNARRTGTNPIQGASTVTLTIPSFVQDKRKLTMVAGGLALVVLVLAILVVTKRSPPPENVLATAPPPVEVSKPTPAPVVPAATTPAVEPAKAPEPAKPDTKVLEPTPSASQIPSPAPVFEPKDAAKEAAKDAAAKDAAKKAADAKAAEKTDASKAGVPPATLVFTVSPWGEIFVNGKARGVTPPMKSIKLEPGKYKIEIRNSTFPPHIENLDLKARDELTVRHKFQ